MQLSDFDYNLPRELIANEHATPRDSSRLFLYNRENGKVEHKRFSDIADYLDANDILVFNDTKVFKARIFGAKKTGGKIEFLLIRPVDSVGANCIRPFSKWETLIRGKVAVGEEIFFNDGIKAKIIEKNEKICTVEFNKNTEEVFKYLDENGEMPLPPYVEKNQRSNLKSQKYGATLSQNLTLYPEPYTLSPNFYQTTYAQNIGSVAAPTAGFHFTPELIERLEAKGVRILHVTLHVGPGTFLPVEAENITEHKMHQEFYEVKKEVWNEILDAKKIGKRIVAVGTTTTRTLEAIAREFPISPPAMLRIAMRAGNFQFPINDSIPQCPINPNNPNNPTSLTNPKLIIGSTDIFIYSPYEFKVVDALITNFHLPKSTLLMLVSAFLSPGKIEGVEIAKKLYNKAVEEKYRFYSFGDSMMIE